MSELLESNNFNKRNEGSFFFFLILEKIIKGTIIMLQAMENYYNSSLDDASAAIINEITKDDPVMKIIANVILDTLGSKAAQCIVLMEEIVIKKIDLLKHISKWILLRLNLEDLTHLVSEMLDHPDQTVRKCVLSILCSSVEFFTETTLVYLIEIIVENILKCQKDENSFVAKELFQFLIMSSQKISSIPRLLINICNISIEKYGIDSPIYSEPSLVILKSLFEREWDSSTHRQLIELVESRYSLSEYLFKTLEEASTQNWFTKVLSAELLNHIITGDDPKLLHFLYLVKLDEIQIRRVAVQALKKANEKLTIKILSDLFEHLKVEDDSFVRCSIIHLIGYHGSKNSEVYRN